MVLPPPLTRRLFVGVAHALLALTTLLGVAHADTPAQVHVCAGCHGAQGVSTRPKIPSLAGQPQPYLLHQLQHIRDGVREVDPMKGLLDGLSDAELGDLASYYQAQTPRTMTARVDQARVARGQAWAQDAQCGSCHQPNYTGQDKAPRLAQQQEHFLLNTMKHFRDQQPPVRHDLPSGSLLSLNDAQLADLAHYFAHMD